ncbi:MAG: RnfABCDGE type electron transport complex subunit G [Clostridia bacterium]|nr:RnfABCDGE type electron transport complex subunit G [Clostridia bacterium]
MKKFFEENKGIIIPTVVMVLICVVVTGALAVTNMETKNPIKEQEEKTQADSMKEVMNAETYEENTAMLEGEEFTYYIAKNGEEIGYIFVTAEKGYGGDDKVMTAVNLDGTIKAVKVLDVSGETPGLGQNAGNPEWYGAFSGLSAKTETKIVKNGADKDKNEVEAVTGATISSTAIKNAVNKAISYYNYLEKEGD